MFKNKITHTPVKVSICSEVLESIFDECDKYRYDETGGRIIGYYRHNGITLEINVSGVIGPGPNAKRSSTSFFQDGDYQEAVFRRIENESPKIEHLGNWHTHHVNGLNTLSSGDLATYSRIVNHDKHNTDFFYAMLVVSKNESLGVLDRYVVKHFLFKRGESIAYEIPDSQVRISKKRPVYLDRGETDQESPSIRALTQEKSIVNEIRSKDKEFLSVLYPSVRPFFSKGTKSLYWKGKLSLADSTSVDLLMLESIEETKPSYSVTLTGPNADRFESKRSYQGHNFDAGWKAICLFERDLNREIFEALRNSRSSNEERKKKWI